MLKTMKNRNILKYSSAVLFAILLISLLLVAYFFLNYMGKKESAKEIECVFAQCCHPTSCVEKSQAPNCEGTACTDECKRGTLDCMQGSCQAINGKCQAVFNKSFQ